MRVLDLRAQAVSVYRGLVLALVKDCEKCINLVRIRWPKLNVERLYVFNGDRSLLLSRLHDVYLASIDEKLFMSSDLVEWHPILRLRPGNIIWHACETPEGIVVQEYGEPPTSLYKSRNGHDWVHVLTNMDVDPRSRHFHYVTYDHYHNLLYATLGDSNLVRVIVICKDRWNPLYRGPWQFVPAAVTSDRVVFGFDSGIARGGVGIYRPEESKWSFTFLRWERFRFAQMSELIHSDGLWIAALGSPQAIVASRDLKLWYPLYVEGYGRDFVHYMSIREEENLIAGSTGSSLVLLKKEEVVIGVGWS